MSQECVLTLDIEEHHLGEAHHPPRFRRALQPLLELMSERGITATFFIVGDLARHWRAELIELAELGHEISLHGYTHRHLVQLGPEAFREEVRKGVLEIGEMIGRPPVGFRAPYFSMTAQTPWAPSILAQEGLLYSSSVLPAWNPQAGYSSAPKTPFRWADCGLVEFPAPVFGVGRLAVPLLGGAYVRLAPAILVRAATRRATKRAGAWTYVHPYDLDVDEPYSRLPDQSVLMARLLFARRRLMVERINSLCGPSAGRLCDLATNQELVAGLAKF